MSNLPNPVDHLIAKTPGWRGVTLAKLREIILDADPEIAEAVKWRRPSSPLGAPVWEHNGMVCIGNVLKASVRLTFPAGASLPDPHGLFNARLDSNTVRAVDILEGERLRASALKALIKSGVKHNLAKASPAKARKS